MRDADDQKDREAGLVSKESGPEFVSGSLQSEIDRRIEAMHSAPPESAELNLAAYAEYVRSGAEVVMSIVPDRLRSRVPLLVQIRRDQASGLVTVWHPETEQIGYGEHLADAVQDFRDTLTELYYTLRIDRDHLGPHLERVWRLLQQYVEEPEEEPGSEC